MKRLHKGFTLIELMIVVAIIGILAAIAIPNFIRFQARSKQSEVKANLKALFTAETAYFQEKDTFSCNIRVIGFTPERGNRYHYAVNTQARTDETCNTIENRGTAAGLSAGSDGRILADQFKYGVNAATANATVPAVAYLPVAPAGTGMQVLANLVGVNPTTADPTGSFGGAAQGNIDNDVNLDLWYMSNTFSTTAGICPVIPVGTDQNAAGGEPKNTYNDVNCP